MTALRVLALDMAARRADAGLPPGAGDLVTPPREYVLACVVYVPVTNAVLACDLTAAVLADLWWALALTAALAALMLTTPRPGGPR